MLCTVFRGRAVVSGYNYEGLDEILIMNKTRLFQVQGSVFTVEYDVYGNQEERILDELEEVEVKGSRELV